MDEVERVTESTGICHSHQGWFVRGLSAAEHAREFHMNSIEESRPSHKDGISDVGARTIPRPVESQGYSKPCTGGALVCEAGAFADGAGILACADATELSAGTGGALACPVRFTVPPAGTA